jgi:pimeloyl-ACP methyl ester carboxylesterase
LENLVTSRFDTIVLIHGLWLTPRSWEQWADHYTEKGFRVLAPPWPGAEAEVEALNAHPGALAKVTMTEIVDHYEAIVRDLDRPPLIIGHSFGGTFMQMLLDRGVGAAGVGLASATVKGVRDMPLSTVRAAGPALNPLHKSGTPLTRKQFHYAFANTLDRTDSDALHDRYAVPPAPVVLREYATATVRRKAPNAVDFGKADRAAMLFVGFGRDHLMPGKVVRHNARKYTRSTVDYIEFGGRPHFPAAPGWFEVADHILAWAERSAAAEISASSRGG